MTENIELPKEEYHLEVLDKKFTIKPLDDVCINLLDSIQLLGGSVKLFPNKEHPTSIFIKYKISGFKPLDVYNYKVVGVELEMQLNLLENHKHFSERLTRFVKDALIAIENELPENSGNHRNKWVQVIDVYKY